ncbi:uncharacterized protein F5147DRAFT_230285 [Suillus discolor]|uniref:Uncharacterized protein n=1 Tax=Suillus discolor TaxID=1912936 RepID=A0A9P7JTA9_9AGAM|nr:uncharacterized protein F5147DRAFT_230285 [Suillus discolor]KAG2106650.1 hypothetical protein F5147DRAFT_230285 [Suillus discolor]
MRRFTAPTIRGSEVHFAASHSLLLMWKSQLASARFCTGRGQYRARLRLWGFFPKEIAACNQAYIFVPSHYSHKHNSAHRITSAWGATPR